MEVIIRKALKGDLKDILDLVIELAIFEKEPSAVTAKLDDYQLAFESGLISCFVACDEQKVIGMTLSYPYFSTWKGMGMFLEDFYVQQNYRRYGIGQKLFDMFVSDAKARGAKLIKWQVLDWNTNAVKFYEKNNASIEKEWWNGKVIF